MKKADQILINGYILTMNKKREILENGAIAIVDGKIEAIGKNADILKEYEGMKYDCNGGVVHPGLADCHHHVCWHLMRCVVPDTYNVNQVWEKYEDPAWRNISAEDEKYSVLLATLEMAVNGTTMFGDCDSSQYMDATYEGGNIIGIKGYTGMGIGDDYIPELGVMQYPFNKCMDLLEEQLKRFPRSKTLRVGAHVGLTGMEHCSGDLLAAAKALAKKYKSQVQIHVGVYEEEVQYYLDRYNKYPIEFFNDLGILDEETTLVHVIHAVDKEMDILEKTRPSVVHCPGASLRYGLQATRGRFPEMRERGVNLALGTDSGNWCDGMDLFEQMYLAIVGHKEFSPDGPGFDREQAFEMATINGAKALGMQDEAGSIETGKAADIVIHGIYRPEMLPASDRLQALIYAGKAKSVRTVLVDGEFIVRDGKPTHVDMKSLAPELNAMQADLLSRMKYKLIRTWPVI